jgi:hypothetical protein
MTDYRISIEELENQAEIAEMARNLIREAFGEIENESPLIIQETEKIELPI